MLNLIDFYVDGKLEYRLSFDENIKSPKKIIELFLKEKDWTYMAWYLGREYVSAKCSRDLKTFRIVTKPSKAGPKSSK